MNLVRTLRSLILCEIGLSLIGMVVYVASRHSLPPEIQRFLTGHRQRAWSSGDWLLLLSLVLAVFSWIGLWRLWQKGRALYTAATVTGVAGTALIGPYVRSGPVEAMFGLGLIVTGLIFGVTYFSDLRHHFDRAVVPTPRDAA